MAALTPSSVVVGKYAVGLTWRKLITSGVAAKLALARAKDEKARFYSHDGRSQVVGLAHFGKKSAPGKDPVYALASMAAKAFPSGEAVFVLRLEEKGWWVGSAIQGAPSSDSWIVSSEQVWAAAQQLVESRPMATVHGDPAVMPECAPLDVDQLDQYANAETALRGAATRLPMWAAPAALALVCFFAYKQGYPWWQARYGQQSAKAAKPQVDALAEWKAATQVYLKQVNKPLSADLPVLRSAIYALPVAVGGWELASVSCVLATQWQCSAKFKRPIDIASSATNRSFEDARPRSWKVSWQGAAELMAAFEVPGTVSTALDEQKHVLLLPAYQVDTYSEFQQVSKIFGKVEISEMARATISPPKNSEGQPIPRPGADVLPELFRANVAFSGPLRNLEMVERTKAPVFWREVGFVRGKSDKDPSLAVSEFQSVFRGEIYAKSP